MADRIYSLIVPAANANFTAHTYTEVYVGGAATVTVNGVSVVAAAGSFIPVKVQSISATANVYLLGEKIDVTMGSNLING